MALRLPGLPSCILARVLRRSVGRVRRQPPPGNTLRATPASPVRPEHRGFARWRCAYRAYRLHPCAGSAPLRRPGQAAAAARQYPPGYPRISRTTGASRLRPVALRLPGLPSCILAQALHRSVGRVRRQPPPGNTLRAHPESPVRPEHRGFARWRCAYRAYRPASLRRLCYAP
ncbi:Uncharacterised protein [Raoultella ornithinolytica]|nr:Uncharacterised protein [Raoultella ornithinolytica]